MTKTISLRVSPDVDRQIRVLAAQMDMNRSDFIRAVLTSKLAEGTRALVGSVNDSAKRDAAQDRNHENVTTIAAHTAS